MAVTINGGHETEIPSGYIVGRIANSTSVVLLIDSGAEVNTVNESIFDKLYNDETSKKHIYCVSEGTDKPLRAYASPGEINVVGTFVTELFISEERPCFFEKFYIIKGGKPLIGRDTALRYSVKKSNIYVIMILIKQKNKVRLWEGYL